MPCCQRCLESSAELKQCGALSLCPSCVARVLQSKAKVKKEGAKERKKEIIGTANRLYGLWEAH